MYNSLMDSTSDFPESQDFVGAVNGLVILFDTYLFDLEYFKRGRIHIENFPTGDVVDMVASHNLTALDYAGIAKHAFEKTW